MWRFLTYEPRSRTGSTEGRGQETVLMGQGAARGVDRLIRSTILVPRKCRLPGSPQTVRCATPETPLQETHRAAVGHSNTRLGQLLKTFPREFANTFVTGPLWYRGAFDTMGNNWIAAFKDFSRTREVIVP